MRLYRPENGKSYRPLKDYQRFLNMGIDEVVLYEAWKKRFGIEETGRKFLLTKEGLKQI